MKALALLFVSPWLVVQAQPLSCDRIHDDRFEGEPCTQNFNVDIPVVTQEIVVTINGDPPPASELENGEIRLRNLDTGDSVFVGTSGENQGEYSIRVIAGEYEAFWEFLNGGSVVPVNRSGRIGGVVVDGSAPLHLDMTRVQIEGAFTLDGAPPPVSALESADISLHNQRTGDLVPLGKSSDGAYTRLVLPGEYEVIYELSQGGLVVPRNARAVVGNASIPATTKIIVPIDVDLESGQVFGDIRINGELPPSSTDDYGRIFFVDTLTGEATSLGNTLSGSYGGRLLAGTYDVYYRAVTPGEVSPVNSNARLIAGYELLPGNHTLDLDIPAVDVDAVVTINGAAPPATVFEDGWIMLRNEGSGDEAPLGRSSENGGVLSARVIPGDYEVFWDLESGGAQVPANLRARLESVQVPADVPLAIDVAMVQSTGDFLLDGVSPPATNFENAAIRLVVPETGDTVFIGETAAGDFQRKLVAGAYAIDYRLEAGGAQVPRNTHAIFGQVCMANAAGVEVQRHVELRSDQIAGGFFFNGNLPPASALESGRIFLVDPVTGGEIPVGMTQDASFNIRVLSGRYEVYYGLETGGALVPRNSRALLGTFRVCP